MRTHLREGLKAALAARDRTSVTALRSALAAIDNAEAVPADHIAATGVSGLGAAEAARGQLTEQDLRRIVEAEILQRLTAATEYARLDRNEPAERLRSEAAVLERQLATASSEATP